MSHKIIASEHWTTDFIREDSLYELVEQSFRSLSKSNSKLVQIASNLGKMILPSVKDAIHSSSLPSNIKEHTIGNPDNPLYGCADITYYRWPLNYADLPKGTIYLANIRYWEKVHNAEVYVQAIVKKSNRSLRSENRKAEFFRSKLFTLQDFENPKQDAAIYAKKIRTYIDQEFFTKK